MQDGVTNRPQLHDKILGRLSRVFDLWNHCLSCVKFEKGMMVQHHILLKTNRRDQEF